MKYLRTLNEQDLLFYDIETARCAKSYQDLSPPLLEAWKYKVRHQNEIEKKTGKEVTPEQYFLDKAALYAPFARIVCIVAGTVKEGNLFKQKIYIGDEKDLLTRFSQDVTEFKIRRPEAKLVGFNSIGFDDPFVAKRMLVNEVILPDVLDRGDVKPWEVAAVDLSKLWQGNAYYPDSLAAVSAALDLPFPKGVLDGSDVGNAFYNGEIKKIADYCVGDVLTTVNIFRRFLQKSLVTLQPS